MNVNIKVCRKKSKIKTKHNPSSSRWLYSRIDHPQPFAFAYICMNSRTCVYCNTMCTSTTCIHGGQFVMKNKRSFNAFSTLYDYVYINSIYLSILLYIHLNHSCLFSKPFYVLFFDTCFFFFTQRIEEEKKLCHKLKALILKMSNTHVCIIICLYRSTRFVPISCT